MKASVHHIWRRRAVVGHLVSTFLTTSYRTKSLGFLWALLDPLLFMGVYYLVFGLIIAHRPLSFMLHIFIGVISFRFLNRSMSQSSGILRSQGGLIREIAFPKAALPVAVVTARLFDFGAGWLIAIPLSLMFHNALSAHWLLIPVLALIQVLLVLGLSFIVAYVGVFFADIQNILEVGLRLWFYLSPVLYDLEKIREKTADYPILYDLYMLNPMANLLPSYYALVQGHRLPDPVHIAYSVGFSLCAFTFGLYVFARAEGEIAKYV